MWFSYKKLWKLLIDKIFISRSAFYKFKNGENVMTGILLKKFEVLQCDISGILEFVTELDEKKYLKR